jgi:hypothetical protein
MAANSPGEYGVAIATGQLWNAFHNCPYGMGIVMECNRVHGARKCLTIKLFFGEERSDFFP